MRIIIDGDGCPQNARKICEEYASYYKIDMIVVSSYDHWMEGEFLKITVDKGRDATDFKVVAISKANDIVVTQDFGLASLLIDKGVTVLNPMGFQYTKQNIDKLLLNRYLGQKIRRSGGRTKNLKKRKALEDILFEEQLIQILEKHAKKPL